MNNKTIAQLLKSAVENSKKESVIYRYNKLFGCDEPIGKRTVVDGEKLERQIQVIIEVLRATGELE